MGWWQSGVRWAGLRETVYSSFQVTITVDDGQQNRIAEEVRRWSQETLVLIARPMLTCKRPSSLCLSLLICQVREFGGLYVLFDYLKPHETFFSILFWGKFININTFYFYDQQLNFPKGKRLSIPCILGSSSQTPFKHPFTSDDELCSGHSVFGSLFLKVKMINNRYLISIYIIFKAVYKK